PVRARRPELERTPDLTHAPAAQRRDQPVHSEILAGLEDGHPVAHLNRRERAHEEGANGGKRPQIVDAIACSRGPILVGLGYPDLVMEVGERISILFIEDSEADLELTLASLRDAGLDPEFERVDSEASLREALERRRWDIVISDFAMPG